MLPKDSTYDHIKNIMIVLYENGVRKIHMGAMMRLTELDENFATMIAELNKNNKSAPILAGATIH